MKVISSSGGHAKALHPEVPRVREVEDQRRDARLGVHHVPFGEVDADLLWAQGLEQLALEGEVRAGGVAEAVALAAIAGGELVLQGEAFRIGEAPVLADAGVE